MSTQFVPSSGSDAPAGTAGRHALIADGQASELLAFRHVLGQLEMTFDLLTDPADLMRQAVGSATPVDVLFAGVEDEASLARLAAGVRVLSRHPATAATAVIVVLPATSSDRLDRLATELQPFTLLKRPLTCEAIRSAASAGVGFSTEARRLRAAEPARPRVTARIDACSSLLARTLSCPYHEFGVPVTGYSLRAGHVEAETDLFDVPVYRRPVGSADFVDYNFVQVAVCPECFFASNDPQAFVDRQDAARIRPDAPATAAVAGGAGEREMSACDVGGGDPPAGLFSFDRTPAEARLAYDLAVHSSTALYTSGPVRRARELLRIGNYHLRVASAIETDSAEARRRREAAVPWLAKAFGETTGGPMYKAAYQLVALHVAADDDVSAFPFLGALKELGRQSRAVVEDASLLERYWRRAEAVWADRDLHRRPPRESEAA